MQLDPNKRTIVVLSGAGVSAESGINTFRDAGGLWEGHDVMEVASPEGFRKNPALVLDFYNQRRRQLKEVVPNKAHKILAELEETYNVIIVTQNVDDLHERAGSTNVVHLHGELKKVRSTKKEDSVIEWEKDCNLGDLCPEGHQLRPHIVWFGEGVPMLGLAQGIMDVAEIVIIIGTSLQVYPAAGLIGFAPPKAMVFYIDPNPASNFELENVKNLQLIKEPASIGMEQMKKVL
jgi:NAD-dependent protein deacetylases, SIR2 family